MRNIHLPAVTALLLTTAAYANYPQRPVRVITTPPAAHRSENLKQQFATDNRPGASGSLGREIVVRAAPVFVLCTHKPSIPTQ